MPFYTPFNMVGVGGQMAKFNIEVYGQLYEILVQSSPNFKHMLPDHTYITHTQFERNRVKTGEIQAKNACRTRNL